MVTIEGFVHRLIQKFEQPCTAFNTVPQESTAKYNVVVIWMVIFKI